tara:strand:+ start:2001 stop:2372 length:372 start_codon:yes stop_codon:yes gene_type:complete
MQNKRISELASTGSILANDLLITSEYNGVDYDSKNITGFDAAQSLRLLAPVLWTIDLMSSLTIDVYAPYVLSIDSVANVKNAPTTTILKNGSAYTLGTSIALGDTINISVSTASVINLNVTQL